jgi:hypothetical protein
MQIIPIGWQPICSKELPYELTVSFLLTPDKPGYPKPLKLQEQHKALFPLNQTLGEESGKKVAEWAKGSKSQPKNDHHPEPTNGTSALSREDLIKAINKVKDAMNPADYRTFFLEHKINVNTSSIEDLSAFLQGLTAKKEETGSLV